MKNSIIAVEAPDEEVDDDEWVDDPEEAQDIIARHRPEGAGPSGDAPGPSGANIYPLPSTSMAPAGGGRYRTEQRARV